MTAPPPPAEARVVWWPGPALLLLLALALAAWGMAGTFGGPFARGWLGHNGARYAQIARNHERLGLLHLRAAPLLDPEPAPGAPALPPDVYAHHPPGLGLTLGVVFGLFGVSEDAARAVPAVATLLSLLLLAWLVAGVAGPWTGALAAMIAAGMPMVSVYGAHVDVQGPPVLLLSLVTLWAYRRWLAGGSVVGVLLASAAASAFDWYGLYAPAGCALHLWFTQPARRRAALGLAAWTAFLFAAWMLWLLTLPGMSWELLRGAAGVRGWGKLFAMQAQFGAGFGAWRAESARLLFGGWPLLTLLLLVRWAQGLRSPLPDRGTPGLGGGGLVGLLLLPPLVHGLLFPTGLLQHGYWLFALPYGIAAAGALALERHWRGFRPLTRRLIVVVLPLLLLISTQRSRELLADEELDTTPALVGAGLRELTAPGDLILTSYDCNPLDPALPAGYVLKHPAVAFYSDRAVRGGIDDPEDLTAAEVALAGQFGARGGTRWFLLTPPPGAWVGGRPDPALARAVAARTVGAPLELSGDPPVTLQRLSP